jgi:hypothetical protein
MKTLQELYSWFFLDTTCANAKISNCKNFLRVAPLEKVNRYNGAQIDKKNFVFAEKNFNWETEYFHGLKSFLWIENSDFPPIFIFDNHNHAIIFRYNIIYNKKFRNAELIHIDQHSDCRENENHLEINSREYELEDVFKFWNEKCNVWNFIPPAIESWMISNQIQIRSTTALKNLMIDKNKNFILDIDLDFCLDWISKDKISLEAVELLKTKFYEIWKSTLWITIATSPYFLDQNLAISILNILFS